MPKRIMIALSVVAMTWAGSTAADEPFPNPQELLRGVVADRLALKSGRLELTITEKMSGSPQFDIDGMRLAIDFDGGSYRFNVDHPYLSIDWLRRDPDPRSTRHEQVVALMGGPDAVVRDGLGYWSAHHVCTIYDGKRLIEYIKNQRAIVGDLDRAIALNAFDPRILGLSTSLRPIDSVEKALSPNSNESVTLVGREEVKGHPAWHVLIGGAGDGRDLERHVWIEPPPGHRVFMYGIRNKLTRSDIVSEYGPPGAGDRLPTRVTALRYHPDGKVRHERIIERTKAEYDIAISPQTWTLAGLELPVGEPIVQRRGNRIVGYWDGAGLSDVPLPRVPVEEELATPKPNLASLLEVARKARGDSIALDALAAIAHDAPSSTEAVEAVKLLAESHPGETGVSLIGLRLIESHPEGTERLFRSILARNPDREDQGRACFGLAQILKARSEHLGQVQPAIEAETLLERVVASYGEIHGGVKDSRSLGDIARADLDELHTQGVGKTAPDLNGDDLDGRPLSLRAHRGKVVVVVFWSTVCAPCLRAVPHERELVTRMKGKPFALLGVSCDEDRKTARATAEKFAMDWPSWRGDSIKSDWRSILGYPRVYVLDSKGVVRFKNLSGRELDKAVDSLMGEAR